MDIKHVVSSYNDKLCAANLSQHKQTGVIFSVYFFSFFWRIIMEREKEGEKKEGGKEQGFEEGDV